jgi:hypothetical protein
MSEEVAGSEKIEVIDKFVQIGWSMVVVLVVSRLVVPKVAVAVTEP